MRILALNCGSSSLKFQLLEVMAEHEIQAGNLASGRIDIGSNGYVRIRSGCGYRVEDAASFSSHADAARFLVRALDAHPELSHRGWDAIGHRVVHGGRHYTEPTLVDEDVMGTLDDIGELAPLHNKPALEVVREMRSMFDDGVPMVATFDTAFFTRLPEVAKRYAIPEELAARHQLWRYGFHGLAHRWMTERYRDVSHDGKGITRLITLHLGSGCSATAIRNGKPLETSMGLTPLEGLMMGTRCGDVDPSLASVLARREHVTPDHVDDWLNRHSGLRGVSGRSGDVRILLDAERHGDTRAALALEMFCHRVRKYIGAYLAVLGGADAVIFGGGIGENQPGLRKRICAGMEWCGLHIDASRNDAVLREEAKISPDEGAIQAYVVPTNEELLIAQDTMKCLRGTPESVGASLTKESYAW